MAVKFEVTKTWQELPWNMITLYIPAMNKKGFLVSCEKVADADAPSCVVGENKFFSVSKLFIKLHDDEEFDTYSIKVQNFI